MEQTNQERQAIERKIVERVIDAILAAGFSLGVNDGEETTIRRSTDKAAVLAAMFTVDEDRLLVYDVTNRVNYVFFVYGNAPGWDVIADCSTGIESLLNPIMAWIEAAQEFAALTTAQVQLVSELDGDTRRRELARYELEARNS